MKRIIIAVLAILALGAVAVIVPASASQNAPSGARWAQRPGHSSSGLAPQAVGDAFSTNDNFFTQTFNHFGNASLGSAIGETWMNSGFDVNGVALNTQGVARAILLPKAARVSIQVELRGENSVGTDQLVTTSSTVNSSGRLTVQVATPEISLASDPRCFFYTRVHMGIRWSDGRLSSVVFEEPIGFTPGPTACTPA